MNSSEQFCKGVDPFNFCETGNVVAAVTTFVGHTSSTGPKVAIRKSKTATERKTYSIDMGEGKSSSSLSIEKSPTLSCTHGGEPVIGTIDASIYRKNNNQDNTKYIISRCKKEKKMEDNLKDQTANLLEEAIKEINRDAPHQQDQLNSQNDAARTLAASTHEAASHLTKTVMKKPEDEICIVRRLTPTECARLQGFPDDYTKIDGPETSDSPQYKADGNSWATPCAYRNNTRIEMELRRLGHKGPIRYATCCSGIEAHSVSVRNLDWQSMFFSEIEPFPCRVLATHYPQTPNLGDMTQIHYDAEKGCITNVHKEGEDYSLPSCFVEAPIQEIPFQIGDMDVFSGGTPCQDVSVAGKRAGMSEESGTRSSLAFHYQRIIDECRPTFTLWEQVPGAFSSNGGADFIWFVNRCAESGYAMAWRVLDAQYVMTEEFPRAVPQRRRRIWLVGYKGNDWRIPARICFEFKKDLTAFPPERTPGLGFKTLNEGAVKAPVNKQPKAEDAADSLFGFMNAVDDSAKPRKVSQMIDFSEMPDEADFSKVSMADIFAFAKRIGVPGYIGSVFRTDKKKSEATIKEFATYDLFSMLDEGSVKEKLREVQIGEETEWVGAEKITPAILENIGNAGILANGRICTMMCSEWTSGIQLSPKTYNAWEEFIKVKDWLNANELLPEAYDGTVCGLTDVLVEYPGDKYNLSWRACFGILKRASTRGKELPSALEMALKFTIRDNAGIVKWFAINGKNNKKKETDLTEREAAMECFNKYIAPYAAFDEVAIEKPGRAEEEEEDIDIDENGNPMPEDDEGFGMTEEEKSDSIIDNADKVPVATKVVEKMPDLPNGVINISGGETAATLLASGDAAVGTTQDANIIATTMKGVDTKMDASRMEDEVSPTLLATSFKEPPAVEKEGRFPEGEE